MKEESHAPETGHTTKGGSLPSRLARFRVWRVLSPSRLESGTPRKNGKAGPQDENGKVPDWNVSRVFREIVFQLLKTEREQNQPTEQHADGETPDASATNEMNGASPPTSEYFFADNDKIPDPNMILHDLRPPRWKRLLDLALLILTACLWLPLAIFVMCVVKIASPGPTIYRQHRIGYRGKPFMIFKFRTMHVNAETRTHEDYLDHLMSTNSPMTKLDASDARLIPCGRFLRLTGLDELPQIFNVIRGDMSLVGPRPCTAIEFQRYRPEQCERVNAAPGITGLWQVNGKNKTTFNEMIALDISYARNMSISLDLAIIWQTIPAILRQTMESRTAIPTQLPRRALQTAGRTTAKLERPAGRT